MSPTKKDSICRYLVGPKSYRPELWAPRTRPSSSYETSTYPGRLADPTADRAHPFVPIECVNLGAEQNRP